MSVKKVERLAKMHKLAAVGFLDANGKHGAKGDLVSAVEMIFDNGEIAVCSVDDFMELQDIQFTLVNEHEWNESDAERVLQ